MIDLLTKYLIKRRNKRLHRHVESGVFSPKNEYNKVLNALLEDKVMVETREDGIYIRMAGSEAKGECFSYDFVKVKSFKL